MKAAFVVQRYGESVVGGAEALCRQLAERLSRHMELHVLTSCAQDYERWENRYPPGVSQEAGVTLHRFPVTRERRARRFRKVNTSVLSSRRTYPEEELSWTLEQGPRTDAMLDYIASSELDYDVFVFFTYLYYPTIWGLPLVARKSVLVPTAHDEPTIYLRIFRSVFNLPRHIIYLTTEERDFVHRQFGNQHIPWTVTGAGIDPPARIDGTRFRRQFGLEGPYILYVGRITESKNCDELFEHFLRYKARNPSNLQLVLLGHAEMDIPQSNDIVYLGYVDEEDKLSAYKGAHVVVMPSHFESLSIVSLEAMSVGTPILVSGHSDVLRGHCQKSNAGLYYTSAEEFAVALSTLMHAARLRTRLGEQGIAYVGQHYQWTEIERRYLTALASVTDPGDGNLGVGV